MRYSLLGPAGLALAGVISSVSAVACPDGCMGKAAPAAHSLTAPAAHSLTASAAQAQPAPVVRVNPVTADPGIPFTASHAPGVVVRHVPSPQAGGAGPASIAILPGGTRPATGPVMMQPRTRMSTESFVTASGAVMAFAPPEAFSYAMATVSPSGRAEVRCDDIGVVARLHPSVLSLAPEKAAPCATATTCGTPDHK